MLTVFIGLILGTKKSKDRRTPLAWVTATGAQQIVPLEHAKEVAPPESRDCAHFRPPVCGGGGGGVVVRGNKKREIVKELRFH